MRYMYADNLEDFIKKAEDGSEDTLKLYDGRTLTKGEAVDIWNVYRAFNMELKDFLGM